MYQNANQIKRESNLMGIIISDFQTVRKSGLISSYSCGNKRRKMESSTPTACTYRQQEEHSPQWTSPIVGETSPARVDPAIYELNESDNSQTRVQGNLKTNVSDGVDGLEVTPTKDESTGTEERKLFNSTKLIEINLGNTGLLKRTVSEPDIINLTRGNSIFWKKRYGTSNTVDPASEIGCGNTHAITRSHSVSLSKWIGNDTISR